jgi:hypothetical protein
MKIKTLYTCCEQAGRRGKDYETKRNGHHTITDLINTVLSNFPSSAWLSRKFLRDNNTVATYSTAVTFLAVIDTNNMTETQMALALPP